VKEKYKQMKSKKNYESRPLLELLYESEEYLKKMDGILLQTQNYATVDPKTIACPDKPTPLVDSLFDVGVEDTKALPFAYANLKIADITKEKKYAKVFDKTKA
jgi:hypothetical protein